MRFLCSHTKNKAFTDADNVPERSRRAAVKMCQHCPIRRQCARDALTAGNSLDGSVIAPAAGVIQAGVACKGDRATGRILAQIAGVAAPKYRKHRKRNSAPSNCVNCDAPMVPWTRGEVPEGYVMHRGRSHCVNCRSAYNALLAEEAAQKGLRKPAPARPRPVTPSHCEDCERPLIPSSHPRRDGAVRHAGRGLCEACYGRARRARKTAA